MGKKRISMTSQMKYEKRFLEKLPEIIKKKEFSPCTNKLLGLTLAKIVNADRIENDLIKRTGDNLCRFRIFDRNKAMRTIYEGINGKATGTCERESKIRIMELLNKKLFTPDEIKCFKTEMFVPQASPPKWVHHIFLLLLIKGKWYYETYSNGSWYRVPFKFKKETQKMRNTVLIPIRIMRENKYGQYDEDDDDDIDEVIVLEKGDLGRK